MPFPLPRRKRETGRGGIGAQSAPFATPASLSRRRNPFLNTFEPCFDLFQPAGYNPASPARRSPPPTTGDSKQHETVAHR